MMIIGNITSTVPLREMFETCALVIIAMIRLAGALAIASFFSRQFVVGSSRNVVIFSMSLPLLYMIFPTLPTQQLSLWIMALVLVKEVVIGVILGFLTNFIFFATEGVGFVIDMQRGASMATIFDPMVGSQTSLMGSFLVQTMSVLFFSIGGFLFFLKVVYDTYQLWPVFSFFPSFDGQFGEYFVVYLNELMKIVFVLSAPVLIVLFLAEFGLGMINRFAPQLNVFFLSMPIKSWLSMGFMLMYLAALGYFFQQYFTIKSKLVEFAKVFVYQ